jgi:homoserine dehydrogenase
MTRPAAPHIRDIKLCMLGFGSVGRTFLAMLRDTDERLAREHGLRFLVCGISTRHSGFLDATGMTAGDLLGIVHVGRDDLCGPAVPAHELIEACGADALIEATVLTPGGQPAAEHIETAFRHGMDVVTVNKGPVAWHFDHLRRKAERNGRRWRFEGTVADGMPVFDLVENCLRSCRIHGFEGILNATTNFVLEALGDGRSFDDAVAHAQREGFAEADPSHDIDGLDAACKVACLANVVLGAAITPDDVPRDSVRDVTPEQVTAARAAGRRLCVVAAGRLDDDGVHTGVRLTELPLDHPLTTIHGSALGLILHTDLMGDVLTAELHGEVQQTAYAVLADLLALYGRH